MTPHRAATVFRVTRLESALQQYVEVFGFTEEFRSGDYAGLVRGELRLHLTGSTLHGQPLGGGAVYGFCDEVDSYYADLQRKGANVKAPPQDQPYGLRDFIVTDADGNRLSFGCETPEA